MLIVLSPAKALDYETPAPVAANSPIRYAEDSQKLISVLRKLSLAQVAELMSLSDKLAALNVARYAAWHYPPEEGAAKPALFAFDGDVYDGLQAKTLSPAGIEFACAHVRILSGLYGILHPLDAMLPYRLEMGTRLSTRRGANLYEFWSDRLAKAIQTEVALHQVPIVINLASDEYFKAIRRPALKARVIAPVFQELRPDGTYKIISFMAKRARGAMTRWLIDQAVTDPKALPDFNDQGYAYHPDSSTPERPVFRRNAASVV